MEDHLLRPAGVGAEILWLFQTSWELPHDTCIDLPEARSKSQSRHEVLVMCHYAKSTDCVETCVET